MSSNVGNITDREAQKFKAPSAGSLTGNDRTEARRFVISYLELFGYLNPKEANDQKLSTALKNLQKQGGLPETGLYDTATAGLMSQPRCGFPDLGNNPNNLAFTTLGGKWDHTNITYRFDSYHAHLTQATVESAIWAALIQWSKVTPLTFVKVAQGQPADIRIRFVRGDHGDGASNAFDDGGHQTPQGFLNTLAHAFPPANGDNNIGGDVHFDAFENWNWDFLYQVALHEIGHALGLGHSTDSAAVMFWMIHGEHNLQADDIKGIQNLYGTRKIGWFNYQLKAQASVGYGSDIAVLSRIPNSMELWYIGPNGSVQDSYWYDNSGWKHFELAPSGSAVAGGIAGVSRKPGAMHIFWVGVTGSIESAFWNDPSGWGRYQVAPPGSAGLGTKIAAISRKPDTLELWWIAPNGSVQDVFWYESSGWGRFELAPAGSAAVGAIAAVSTTPDHLEIWWIAPNGAVIDAFVYVSANRGWSRFEVAPPGSASTRSSIAAVSRVPDEMEIFWIAPNRSVQNAYTLKPNPWRRFELEGPDSAAEGGIKAVSRIPGHIEVFWTGLNGSIQDAFFYENMGWQRFQLGEPGSTAPGSNIAAVSRIDGSMETWYSSPVGALVDFYWYG